MIKVAERMTAAQFRALPREKRRKYGNRKVVLDGVRIDSSREARRWLELQIMEKAGSIRNLERQKTFVLAPKVRLLGEKRAKPAIRYVADFLYFEGQTRVVEDVKSAATAKTPAWRLKLHLMKSVHNLDVRVVR